MNNTASSLGEEKISTLLRQFSLPSIVSMIASSLYIVIDRIFIGQIVGAAAIAGVSVTMPISIFMLAFGAMIAFGAGTLVSIRLGQNKRQDAEAVLGAAIILVAIISLLTSSLPLFFIDDILKWLGASPATLPYARDFIRIILIGSVFQYVTVSFPVMIRAEGNPRTVMNIVLANVIANFILDVLFVYMLGWGVSGAAAATVVSQMLSSALVIRHFLSSRSLLRIKLQYLRFRGTTVRALISAGSAPFVLQIASSAVIFLYNLQLGRYGGDIAIGAYGIIYTVITFMILPISGISLGAQPILGFNIGARRYDRVIAALRLAALAATAIAAAGFIILMVFPGQLFYFFTGNSDIIGLGSHGLQILAITLPLAGLQTIGCNFFQAAGKSRIALLLTLLRHVILQIPAVLFLPCLFQIDGIWLAGPAADLLAGSITLAAVLREVQAMKNKSRDIAVAGQNAAGDLYPQNCQSG